MQNLLSYRLHVVFVHQRVASLIIALSDDLPRVLDDISTYQVKFSVMSRIV